jgi:alpha-L-rhamnosidase
VRAPVQTVGELHRRDRVSEPSVRHETSALHRRVGRDGWIAVAVVVAIATGAAWRAASDGGTAAGDHPPGAPTRLTVDDGAAPLAVQGAPQFGWLVVDADRGELQTGYQLLVATRPTTDPGDPRVVWTSGRVASGQQAYVTANVPKLAPGNRYFWTVRTWDRRGLVGPFARPASFGVGLGDGDWHASWIRQPGIDPNASEDFTLARTEQHLEASPIVRAVAYVSAGQQYDLRINAVRVAHGPSFSYPDEQYYEATDVTASVQAGATNAIGVIAHWESPGQGRPASVPALIARITIEHVDGTREVITTNGTWRVRKGPWVPAPLRNSEGDHVEHIDGRADPIGWDRPGFDDRSWAHALVLGPHPVAPFLHLIAARSHIVEQRVRPRSLTRLPDGAYVADFGAVIAATPVVTLHHGVAGRPVKVTGGYVLDPNGHVSTTRGTQQTDMHWDYDERAGAQQFRPFDYLGYRYLEVAGSSEEFFADDVVADARHASMPDENAASFQTSNAGVDAVWNLARHSALYDTQEQVLDTPTREKGAFMNALGDSRASMFAFGERAITYQALRDFARSQARYWPDGRVNVVYPNGDGGRDIPDSTEGFVEWVWRVYMTTGDRGQLASLYPVMRNISAYVARAIDLRTDLVTNLPGGGGDYLGGIVDWPPNMRYGYDVGTAARTTENVLAVDIFHRLAQMAGELARPNAEIADQQALAQRVTRAIGARLTRSDGVLVDGLEADRTASRHASQLANALALEYGLVPADHVARVSDYIVGLGNRVGVPTFEDLVYGLHAGGHDDAIVKALTDPTRPGYAQILADGATFTWEAWDARTTGDSESHGFGAGVLPALQEDILGVSIVAPGAAQVDIRTPNLTMTARGVVATQRGSIPISWTRGTGQFRLTVTIPANMTAAVHIPARRRELVRESGHALSGDPGVVATHTTDGTVVVTIGSGHYEFQVANHNDAVG